jgi:hypothetical protein
VTEEQELARNVCSTLQEIIVRNVNLDTSVMLRKGHAESASATPLELTYHQHATR